MKRRSRIAAAALLAGLLAACGNGGGDGALRKEAITVTGSQSAGAPPPMPAAAPEYAGAPMDVVEEGPGGSPPLSPGADPAVPQPARQIAYAYFYTLAAPTDRMEALFNAQKAACEQAGPQRCYVVNSSISGLSQEAGYGQLQVKASADWIEQFRSGLTQSLEAFDAEVDSTTSTAEDLTVQMVDTGARLNSAKTLRDRLQKLLAERPGKLADLIEIERELARVQAEIDATESVLAAMRLRVAMSDLTLTYQARYTAASESIWRPLGDAFQGFLPSVVLSLAAIVEFISATLLWILLLGAVAAGLGWLWRRRRARRKGAAAPTVGTSAGP